MSELSMSRKAREMTSDIREAFDLPMRTAPAADYELITSAMYRHGGHHALVTGGPKGSLEWRLASWRIVPYVKQEMWRRYGNMQRVPGGAIKPVETLGVLSKSKGSDVLGEVEDSTWSMPGLRLNRIGVLTLARTIGDSIRVEDHLMETIKERKLTVLGVADTAIRHTVGEIDITMAVVGAAGYLEKDNQERVPTGSIGYWNPLGGGPVGLP